MKKIISLLSLIFVLGLSEAQTTLTEGFETWPAIGWEVFTEGESTRTWRHDFENISHSGDHSADSNIANNQMDNWLVSPAITIINSNFELKFWEIYEEVRHILPRCV